MEIVAIYSVLLAVAVLAFALGMIIAHAVDYDPEPEGCDFDKQLENDQHFKEMWEEMKK